MEGLPASSAPGDGPFNGGGVPLEPTGGVFPAAPVPPGHVPGAMPPMQPMLARPPPPLGYPGAGPPFPFAPMPWGGPPFPPGMPPGPGVPPRPDGARPWAPPSPEAVGRAWRAHRTAEGRVYYFNILTNQSSWERPPGFKGDAPGLGTDVKPVSARKIEGTKWKEVELSDGRKYFVDTETNKADWAVPLEIQLLRRGMTAQQLAILKSKHANLRLPGIPAPGGEGRDAGGSGREEGDAQDDVGDDAGPLREPEGQPGDEGPVPGPPLSPRQEPGPEHPHAPTPHAPAPHAPAGGPWHVHQGYPPPGPPMSGPPMTGPPMSGPPMPGPMPGSAPPPPWMRPAPTPMGPASMAMPMPMHGHEGYHGHPGPMHPPPHSMGHPPGGFGGPPPHQPMGFAAPRPAGEPREVAEQRFRQLLAESGLTPFSMYAKEEPRLKQDPRFKALGPRDRRAVFDGFCQELAQRSNQAKEEARAAAMQGPGLVLKEVAEALRAGRDFRRPLAPKEPQEEDPAPPPPPAVEGEEGEITAGDGDGGRGGKAGPDEEVLEMTSSLTLPDVVSFFADDPRMVGAGEDTLKRLWDEIVAPALQHARKASAAGKAAKRAAFLGLLRSRGVEAGASWGAWRDRLAPEEAMADLGLDEAEELFRSFVQGGEGARDGADRAQGRGAASGIMAEPDGRSSATADAERRLQRARQEEAARQFSALLGEVVRDADGDWRDWEQRLRRDPLGRGSSRDMTDRERRDMFSAHVAELRKRGEAEFRALLADRLSGMAAEALRVSGGAVPAPASLPAPLSSWEAAEELLQADPRYARMPERMREHAWRVWVEAALTGTLEALESMPAPLMGGAVRTGRAALDPQLGASGRGVEGSQGGRRGDREPRAAEGSVRERERSRSRERGDRERGDRGDRRRHGDDRGSDRRGHYGDDRGSDRRGYDRGRRDGDRDRGRDGRREYDRPR